MTILRAVLLVTAAMLSSGCSTSPDPCARDARDDGVLGATVGVLGGGYEACTRQLRMELAEAEVRATRLRQQAIALEGKANQLAQEERAATIRLAQTNRQMSDIIGRIKRLQNERTVSDAKLRELHRREAELSQELLEASENSDEVLEMEIVALEREERALVSEIEAVEDTLDSNF